MKLELSREIFEKYSILKFYENLSSGSRVVPCGRADMTKPMVAFRIFINPPKIDDGRKENEEVEGGDIFRG
jgi:hypothetical protein